ncbi:MAG: sodium-coupled permease [Planctomycetaceae bacterium]
MAVIDWCVVVSYFVVMLAIGWYYSRQKQSAEDYALGGRKINPIMAGLSLFSTLASTLTYLAIPSEIIGHGPMLLANIAAFPLVWLIVGWLLIPYLMKLPVTSAYEILEKKLGTGIRMAGASLFVLLRLGWMSAILYASSSVVLIPLLQLDDSMTPVVCAVLGIITIIYSSEGGMKAVVVTDALQALMMLAGAGATILVISSQLGGVSEIFPKSLPAHWDPIVWGFDIQARIAFLPYMLSTLLWYVCTNGSDQMSIQRFLSTRDAPTARRTLAVSLTSDSIVASLLAMTGLALLSYYTKFPEQLAAGLTTVGNADRIFPSFIQQGMPFGISGLVVAAILAAAMSSLASGLNSTSVVIERDFLQRWLGSPTVGTSPNPEESLRSVARMKKLTVAMGLLAILLSIGNMFIHGNLLERCNKVVNLLTAPIFVLFFLALFIPWSNAIGAWSSLIASIGIAILVAYGHIEGLSPFWMTPISLVVGIVVGVAVSGIVHMTTVPSDANKSS